MKLELSLPERPGYLFYVPALNLLALIMALLTLTDIAEREGVVEVSVPPSQFRGDRLGDENPVVVSIKKIGDDLSLFVAQKKVSPAELVETLRAEAASRETTLAVLKVDEQTPVSEQQSALDAIMSAGLRCYLAVRNERQATRALIAE